MPTVSFESIRVYVGTVMENALQPHFLLTSPQFFKCSASKRLHGAKEGRKTYWSSGKRKWFQSIPTRFISMGPRNGESSVGPGNKIHGCSTICCICLRCVNCLVLTDNNHGS